MTEGRGNNTHYLLAGSLFAHEEPHVVTTVLGSCVSVCLWDCMAHRGGINHYMLPLWNGEGLASPKYGNIAILKLIERMRELGSEKRNLRAKVFGGGVVLNVTNSFMNIGERNIQLADDVLRSENIQIISADTGGNVGRKIIFNTESGTVLVKKLMKQIDDIRI
ncbi:MAG: chemotaxis protein CheD [Nitrospirota bacterium]|nr:chemotaxis protein CheD [Nitrospirota bacterium]